MIDTRAGFTAAETLAALALTTIVLSVVALVVEPALDQVVRVPEAADLHDRGRAAESILRGVLEPAGTGADLVSDGPLSDAVPAVWPRRLGRWGADADGSAWADRFTVLQVPWLAAQAPVASAEPPLAPSVTLAPHDACGTDASCGFRAGDHVALIEPAGAIDFTRVTSVSNLVVSREPSPAGVMLPALAAAIDMSVIYFDPARRQLRRYDGVANDQPLVDDVVWMGVRYYGDPLPPRRPAVAGQSTCVVHESGAPLLPLLGPVPAPLVELVPAVLADGPWCGRAPWRFDADVLRIRAVRIALRLQANGAAVRGRGPAFWNAGTSTQPRREVRDLGLDVFVTPRVLAGGN